MQNLFTSLVIEENPDGSFSASVKKKSVEDLPVGELLIKVSYSSLNYKDALSVSGNKGVTKSYPHTPGIDAVGIVEHSETKKFKIGDAKWINLKGNEVRSEWEVQSPSGIKNLIVPNFSKESLKITDTNEHGIYSVFKNKKLYTSFSTELHQSEIVSKQISENEADILFKELEYKWIAPSNNFINVFNEIRYGKALWKLFLILAIFLFLLETWVGRPATNNLRK